MCNCCNTHIRDEVYLRQHQAPTLHVISATDWQMHFIVGIAPVKISLKIPKPRPIYRRDTPIPFLLLSSVAIHRWKTVPSIIPQSAILQMYQVQRWTFYPVISRRHNMVCSLFSKTLHRLGEGLLRKYRGTHHKPRSKRNLHLQCPCFLCTHDVCLK